MYQILHVRSLATGCSRTTHSIYQVMRTTCYNLYTPCSCPMRTRHANEVFYIHQYVLRAALHIEAKPIRCVRGLKSSLVIGQKAQIGPNSFTPIGWANLVVWFFKLENVFYDTTQARWIGCTQHGGPILSLETNVIFHQQNLLKSSLMFFSELDPLDYVEI
jgi:hypothetical protein